MRWGTRTIDSSCPRTALRGALLRAIAMPVGFVVTLAVGLAVMDTPKVTADTVDSQPSAVQRLLAGHDCWSGRAPADMAGRLPGHVVVSVGAGRPRYSARMVKPALAHVFDDAHPAITVHGFCR
jgi:hypothetical protein